MLSLTGAETLHVANNLNSQVKGQGQKSRLLLHLHNQVRYNNMKHCIKIWPAVFMLQAIFLSQTTKIVVKVKGQITPRSDHSWGTMTHAPSKLHQFSSADLQMLGRCTHRQTGKNKKKQQPASVQQRSFNCLNSTCYCHSVYQSVSLSHVYALWWNG